MQNISNELLLDIDERFGFDDTDKTKEILGTLGQDMIDILIRESHQDHRLVVVDGRVRWEENPHVREWVDRIGLNEILILFMCLGYDKNSEEYRHLYRSIGYSLYGYWEIFYWDVNNPEADEYNPL